MVSRINAPNFRTRCTNRLLYNGADKAVVLTAAHCILDGPWGSYPEVSVNFDSQVNDDTTTPYGRDVITPDRAIRPDDIVIHPLLAPWDYAEHPSGGIEQSAAGDLALVVVDDPEKLHRLNTLWDLPAGRLVDLPAPGYLTSLSPVEFRALPLMQVGFGTDHADPDGPYGPGATGGYGNAGFRSVVSLTPVASVARASPRLRSRTGTSRAPVPVTAAPRRSSRRRTGDVRR